MQFNSVEEGEVDTVQHLKKLERKKKRIKRAYNRQARRYSQSNSVKKSRPAKEIVVHKRLPCHLFKMGKCDKGDSCDFSHNIEQGLKDQLCRFYIVNACTNTNCQFSHDKSKFQCKYLYITGKCEKNSRCTFSHQAFKSKASLHDFIQSNVDMIIDCLKNNILTATNKYARNEGLLIKANEENTEEDIGAFLQLEDRQSQEEGEITNTNPEPAFFDPF